MRTATKGTAHVQRDANVTVKLNGQPLFFPRLSSSRRGATAEEGGAGEAGGLAEGAIEPIFAFEALPSKGQLDTVQALWVHETCAQICPLVKNTLPLPSLEPFSLYSIFILLFHLEGGISF